MTRWTGFYGTYPEGIPFRFSPHAIERALEMGLEGDEIADAMKRPERSYWSQKHRGWCLTRGPVSIGVKVQDGVAVVTTVLWATREGWERDYARGGITDRTPRDRMFA